MPNVKLNAKLVPLLVGLADLNDRKATKEVYNGGGQVLRVRQADANAQMQTYNAAH